MFRKFINYRNRRIQTDILFETTMILVVTVLLIIGYTYHSNTQSIVKQSQQYMRSFSNSIKNHILEALNDAQNIVETYQPLLIDFSDDLTKAPINTLISFSNILDRVDQVTTVYIGTENGMFLEIGKPKTLENYLKSINVSVPENTVQAFQIIDRRDTLPKDKSAEASEIWYFLSAQGATSDPIVGPKTQYDPRKRGWYKKSSQSRKSEWSEVYIFNGAIKNALGITVSRSITDKSGQVKGVFGVDITLQSFSQLLSGLTMGPNMKICILDENNQIIATSDLKNKPFKIVNDQSSPVKINEYSDVVMREMKENFDSSKTKDEILIANIQNEKYIGLFSELPKFSDAKWSILVITPEEDFVGEITKNRNLILGFSLIVVLFAIALAFRLARRISVPIRALSIEANQIRELKFDNKSTNITSCIREINDLALSISSLKTSIKSFSYYIPKTLVSKLLNKKQSITIGGRSKEVTLFFSDIANFTSITETLSPEYLVQCLSEYFEEMSAILSSTDATIDKYIGDAIMAFWGAPIPDKNHSYNACLSALMAQRKLYEMSIVGKKDEKPFFKTRIGIHTGKVIIGNIGSSERMNYTAIGDSVNLCARLESLNKFYGTSIIASETVYNEVKDKFLFRPLDRVAVKGKEKSIGIFELLGILDGNFNLIASEEQQAFCALFERAYNTYLTRQWKEATDLFNQLKILREDDLSVSSYLERCAVFSKNPPPQDWDGSYVMTKK